MEYTEDMLLTNCLPHGGEVYYFGSIFTTSLAHDYLKRLFTEIEWEHDKINRFGKTIVTKRKVAWYGDFEFSYTYSNSTKKALPWCSVLLELKVLVEQLSGEKYNSCLLNLYHTGAEGMGWHCDAEKEIKKNSAIASISFGAERKFVFKHKHSQETVSLFLQHGSLLVMKGETQTYWLHRLPHALKVSLPRINLTFRMIDEK